MIALAVASVVVALVLAEILLRTLAPRTLLQPGVPDYAWLAYDPINGMVNEPGFHERDPRITRSHLAGELRINELGFRGEEIETTKPGGVTRIVCLGDSSTFGLWLASGVAWQADADFRIDNDYPRLVEERLRADGRRVEVVNAGVVGYNSSHGVRQLLTRVLPLAPDVVTVRFGFNDHAFSDPATYVRDPESAVARTLFYALAPLETFRLGVARVRRSVGSPAVPAALFEANIRRLAGLARDHGVHLLLLDYPLRPLATGIQVGEVMPFLGGAPSLAALHERHGRYQRVLHATAAGENVPVVATADALGDPAAFSLADLVHPNPHGAALVAGRVAEAIAGRGWSDAGRLR
jgi:lysophospholipase L1-like esterase